MDGKFLGKIQSVTLGFDDRGWFGPMFDLRFDGASSVGDSRTIPPVYKDTFSYTPEEWAEKLRDDYAFIYVAMRDAGVSDFNKLAGTPIEVEIEGNMLKSWRVLKEVL